MVQMGARFADSARKSFPALEICQSWGSVFRNRDASERGTGDIIPLRVVVDSISTTRVVCGLLAGLGATTSLLRNHGIFLSDLQLHFAWGTFGLSRARILDHFNAVRLLSIHFDPDTTGDAVVSTCANFGPSLKVLILHTDNLNTGHYHTLRERCPNAKINVQELLQWDETSADSLVAIGEAALCLPIENPDIVDNLSRIGNSCPKLQRISCRTDNMLVSRVCFLFGTPKRKLVKLCLFTRDDVQTQIIDDMFQVLTEKVSTLEEFNYTGPVPSIILLPPFVAENQNLESASITLDFSDGSICPCRSADTLEGTGSSSVQNGKRIWNVVVGAFLQNQGLVSFVCACDGADNHDKLRYFATSCSILRTYVLRRD